MKCSPEGDYGGWAKPQILQLPEEKKKKNLQFTEFPQATWGYLEVQGPENISWPEGSLWEALSTPLPSVFQDTFVESRLLSSTHPRLPRSLLPQVSYRPVPGRVLLARRIVSTATCCGGFSVPLSARARAVPGVWGTFVSSWERICKVP